MLHASLVLLAVAFAAQQPPAGAAGPAVEAALADLLPARPAEARAAAFTAVREARDRRLLAPLVDLLRFADTREEWFAVLDAAGAILGEDLRALERPWRALTLRLAADDAYEPPPGYAAWKGELLAQRVDPRFREFLHAGVETRVRLNEVVWGGVPVDGIPALESPPVREALHALDLDPAEPVFGVGLNGAHRAYPLRVLDWHELANDELGGVPIALAYCTLCGAGVVYRREVEGEATTFGTSGLLMRSNKLMFDRATRTLWNQLTGEPVVGPLARSGAVLEVLPGVVTTWGAWRARHPDTTVLDLDTGHDRDYRPGAAYGEYFASAATMFPAHGADAGGSGPSAKDLLVAVRAGGAATAFPVERLRARGVWNHRVGATPVVVVGPPAREPVPLPDGWREALAGLRERRAEDGGAAPDPLPTTVDELAPADLAALLGERPSRIGDLHRDALLALSAATRRALLARFGPDGPEPLLDARTRDELASFALAHPARAYERGAQSFRQPGRQPGERPGPGADDAAHLLDERGARWTITEAALEGPDGERLPRLPAHMLFTFAWESFFPGGELAE